MAEIVGTLMVRRDRPSFEWFFPLMLERTMPLLDHLHVRIDPSGDDVVSFLEPWGDKVTWEWQFDHPHDNHLEDRERQALLDWAISTGAKWCFAFDSDEVLEEGAADAIRRLIEREPLHRAFGFPLSYASHHRPGYILDRNEPDDGRGVTVGRGFRLDSPELREFRYKGDADGLHCGTMPIRERSGHILRELYTVHYHACTPEEWLHKRDFYADTEEVRKHGGIDKLYPLCGEPPYACDRFGKEANARPYTEVVVNAEERFEAMIRRLERVKERSAGRKRLVRA